METFSVLLSVLSKREKGETTLENEGCKTRMDGLLFKLVELDSLLSWCLFNPSLVTAAKLFLQVINFAFLIFQVSDKVMDSGFAAATVIPNCNQDQGMCLILCPPKFCFLSPVLCFSDRPARTTASPPLFWEEMSECL